MTPDPGAKRQSPVHHWFELQAERTPDGIAVVAGLNSLTYAALNKRANKLAWHLKALGVGPNTPVGICLERSLDLIVAVYAVLKAGGMYVPLDPAYPEAHLAYMLESLDCPVLIAPAGGVHAGMDKRRLICVDSAIANAFSSENPPAAATPDDLIYTIFTSGSTGRPKGAAVYHRGFTNLLDWFVAEFSIGPSDRALLVSSFSFDLTQKNLFATLAAGGTLHLLPSGRYDPAIVTATVREQGITLLNCTPSAAYPLFEDSETEDFAGYRSLRCLFLGGEPISTRRLRSWTQSTDFRAAIVNTYGPTECSDICAFHVLGPAELAEDTPVPIGRPIFNTELAVVDEDMSECPSGAIGELCVAGRGIGAGYITDTHLNAARFIPNPLPAVLSGQTVYRTGDMARRRPDGVFDFFGRADHQVKIRGFRIEPGEIEATLESYAGVKSAVVISRPSGDGELSASLAAYVTGSPQGGLDVQAVRQFLRDRLPEHMVPGTLTVIDRMPLSPNGKVDRRRLLELANSTGDAESDTSLPELEGTVAGIWCAVLQVGKIGLDENFFDAGGDSLLAIEAHRRLARAFPSCGLSVTTLFEHSTIRALCGQLRLNLSSVQPVAPAVSPVQERAKKQMAALAGGARASVSQTREQGARAAE